jgi:hypothetical protein
MRADDITQPGTGQLCGVLATVDRALEWVEEGDKIVSILNIRFLCSLRKALVQSILPVCALGCGDSSSASSASGIDNIDSER